MDNLERAMRLSKRIKELKDIRNAKGDYRESFPVAYNQWRNAVDNNHDKLIHIIVPTHDGDQTIIKRYFNGTPAEVVRRASEIYAIPDIDSDDTANTDTGEYGIYKVETVANNDLRYSSNDIQDIIKCIFNNVKTDEIKKEGRWLKTHNFYDVLDGLKQKFNIPVNGLYKRYGGQIENH